MENLVVPISSAKYILIEENNKNYMFKRYRQLNGPKEKSLNILPFLLLNSTPHPISLPPPTLHLNKLFFRSRFLSHSKFSALTFFLKCLLTKFISEPFPKSSFQFFLLLLFWLQSTKFFSFTIYIL